MAGEKPTDKALIPTWTGASGITDALESPYNSNMIAIGTGETGNRIVAELLKIGVTRIQTATLDKTGDQLEELLKGKKAVFIIAHLDEIKLKDLQKLVALTKKQVNILTVVITTSLQTRNEMKKSTPDSLSLICQKCETVFIIDNDKLEELKNQLPYPNVSERVIAHIIKIIMENTSCPNLIFLDSTDFTGEIQISDPTAPGLGEIKSSTNLQELIQKAKSPILGISYKSLNTVPIVTQDRKLSSEYVNNVKNVTERITTEDYQINFVGKAEQVSSRKIVVTLMIMKAPPRTISRCLKEIELFDLEPYSRSESRLALDFGLYQLENF